MASNPLKSITGALRAHILIDCPASHVWKCVFEYPHWAPSVKFAELVSGKWDQEGGVALITKHKGSMLGLAAFYATNVKMRPFKQQVYQVDTKDGDQMHGFLDISMEEVGAGKTRATYSNYVTYQFATKVSLGELQGPKAEEGIIEGYLRPLKAYCEQTWK